MACESPTALRNEAQKRVCSRRERLFSTHLSGKSEEHFIRTYSDSGPVPNPELICAVP